jgi:histo-blood group ABO system transferase
MACLGGFPIFNLQGIKMIKVGLVVIATNKYIKFVKPLYDSMQRLFLNEPDIRRQMFLFTNQNAFEGPVIIAQKHEPWPNMTLKRYEIFYRNQRVFGGMDYLYYTDADMIFLDHVGREVLGERVATVHPGFWNSPRQCFPYETNPQSTAYIRMDEGDYYFAGGFNGGKRERFLEMAKVISENINHDLEQKYIAVWHDESHLNRYLIDRKPTVLLNPSYCFPEAEWARQLPFRQLLVALDKNHEELRS